MAYTHRLIRAAAQISRLSHDLQRGAREGGEWQFVSYAIELREEMDRVVRAAAQEVAEMQRRDQLTLLKNGRPESD